MGPRLRFATMGSAKGISTKAYLKSAMVCRENEAIHTVATAARKRHVHPLRTVDKNVGVGLSERRKVLRWMQTRDRPISCNIRGVCAEAVACFAFICVLCMVGIPARLNRSIETSVCMGRAAGLMVMSLSLIHI